MIKKYKAIKKDFVDIQLVNPKSNTYFVAVCKKDYSSEDEEDKVFDMTFVNLKVNGSDFNSIKTAFIDFIKEYDASEYINSFYYKGKTYWFDKNTRVGLINAANMLSDDDDFHLVLDNEIVTLKVDELKVFLKQLEIYAINCFITTQEHINHVQLLDNYEELSVYDFTEGYPNKITLVLS